MRAAHASRYAFGAPQDEAERRLLRLAEETYHPRMDVLPQRHFTVEQYLGWAFEHPGRYELHCGRLFRMAPGGVRYARTKLAIQIAFHDRIRAKKLPCHMLPNGPMVRIDDDTAYEPDAMVYCGEKIESKSLEVPNPMIVVEVLSPSTRDIDTSLKLGGYFRLPSVAHYLIVDPAERFVLHHSRGSAGEVVGHIVREGAITLDPPGLTIAMDEIYGGV